MSWSWLQESYSLLHKFKIHVAREEMERVDTLRYAWEKLSTLAVRSTCKACSIQVQELVYIIIGINVKLSCDFTATLIYFGGKCMKGVRREQVRISCEKWSGRPVLAAKSGTTLPKVVLPCQSGPGGGPVLADKTGSGGLVLARTTFSRHSKAM